ncbi:MAG: S41 family peptidase [Rickettsiales bacterium]|nr:MAG: S41 family peptidase [Rickettsiales bacterium]
MKKRNLILFLCIIFTSCFAAETKQQDSKYAFIYNEVAKLVKSSYVEDIEEDKFFDASLNGMLTSLDPHSAYYNKEEYQQLIADTDGEFSGLGIEVTMENQMVKVVTPIDDTPAFKAGVKAGDYISEIDNKSVVGMSLRDAVKMMRGKDAKDRGAVKLLILRMGENEPLEINLKRDLIKVKSVKSRKEGKIAYIRISQFTAQTQKDLEKAAADLKKEIGKDVKGIVLDLRNNPGGLLDMAVSVSESFLPEGKKIVSIKGKGGAILKEYKSAKKSPLFSNNIPLVVLINEGSASASEIVAGALQDNKRGLILGIKSFGKGSVQSVIPLNTGSAIKLTIAKYYTPNDISIQANGIVPDVEVKLAKLEEIDISKYVRKENDLKGHLSKENNDLVKKELEKQLKTGNESMYNKDYQLARAIDLLLGISFYQKEVK